MLPGVGVAASHIWLDGLSLAKDLKSTGFKAQGAVREVVVRRCSFHGFHNSLVLSRESRDWYIADNVVIGDNDPEKGQLDGEGIDLFQSEGHVVAHNRVARVQAGVHYARRNCDIYGNDIRDTTDDGIEAEYGYSNIRIWGNRITNCHANGISIQPMYCQNS